MSSKKSEIKLKKLVKFLLGNYDIYFDKSKFKWESFKYFSTYQDYREYYLYYDGKKILKKTLHNNGFNKKFKRTGVYSSKLYTFVDDYWAFEEFVGDSYLCRQVFLKWIEKNNI